MELDCDKVKKEKRNEYIEVAHFFPLLFSPVFEKALKPIDKSKKR